MKVVQTKDTMSNIYLDAVRIRHQVFVVEQGVPLSREIDKDEAHCIHFVLYSDKKEPQGNCTSFAFRKRKNEITADGDSF